MSDPTCDEVREALSARHDGEDPGLGWSAVRSHLEGCPGCRRYHAALGEPALQPVRLRAEGPPADDLVEAVTRDAPGLDRAGVWWVLRALLALVAVAYLVTAVPEMAMTENLHHGHLARHLGIFEAAYGVMLLVVAVRPARARAVVPFTAVLAVGMAVVAIVDVARGKAFPLAESGHLLEVAGLVLVWLLAARRGWPRRAGGSGSGRVPPVPRGAAAGLRVVPDADTDHDGPWSRAG
jgi:predicted anti-sigma-YlaC factor YlaD